MAFEFGGGEWKQKSPWLADNPDEGGEFAGDIDGLITSSTAQLEVERIFIPTSVMKMAGSLSFPDSPAGRS